MKSLVIIGLTKNRTIEVEFENRIEVPDGFGEVNIFNNVLKPLDANVLGEVKSETFSEKEINALLNNNKIGQQILSYWFARQADGTFNIDSIEKRKLLNTLEINLLTEPSKKRMSSENTDVQRTINSTYIILVDFKNIQTMDEYYDESKTEDEYRILEGFISTYNYYLIKLDFNSFVASHFFNNYWITDDTEQNLNKKQEFVVADFPFALIKAKSDQVASTQHVTPSADSLATNKGPNEKLLGNLVDLAIDKAVLNFENENAFFKFNRIQGTDPITASMGVEEDLKFDRRYSVFVNRMNELGKVEKKNIGVVKSMKIVDNRPGRAGVTDLSEFYQIGGKRITSSGMYLEKKNDLGINIAFDRSVFGPSNTSGRIEYYFSKLFDGAMQKGKSAQAVSSMKIYFEARFNDDTYSIEESNRKFEFWQGTIGLSKDFYPIRFLHWSPFVGYGLEAATWSGSDNQISTNFVETGLRLGVNIVHNVQLIGTFKNNFFINSILLDGEREVLQENFNYKKTFSDRKGISIGIGMRVML